MHEHHIDRVHSESVVLDVGGDIGAMILYTGPEYRAREIEISPVLDPDARTHVEILERQLDNGETVVPCDDLPQRRKGRSQARPFVCVLNYLAAPPVSGRPIVLLPDTLQKMPPLQDSFPVRPE
jgi:hypothetical protein